MTLSEARQLLPNFAHGLARHQVSVEDLRSAIKRELVEYINGNNPLTPIQRAALNAFLIKTREAA